MKFIVIKKGNQRKPVTPYAWENMGPDKQGWEIAEDNTQTVSNEVKTAPASTDDKKTETPQVPQNVSNEAVNSKIDNTQTVSNETNSSEGQNPISNKVTELAKASDEFAIVAEGLTTGPIKDFLDINRVSYKPTAKKSELINHLAAHLKNDVELLKTEFGL